MWQPRILAVVNGSGITSDLLGESERFEVRCVATPEDAQCAMRRWRRPPDSIVLEADLFRTLEGEPDPEGFLGFLEWLAELCTRRGRSCRCIYVVYAAAPSTGKRASRSSLLGRHVGLRVIYTDQHDFRRRLQQPAQLLLDGAVDLSPPSAWWSAHCRALL